MAVRIGLLFYSLSLEQKQAINANATFSKVKPKSKRILENQKKITEDIKENGRSKCSDITRYSGLSKACTRAIIANRANVDRNRAYRK